MQVIPAINVQNLAAAKEKLAVLEKFVPKGSWLQLDVGDGIFSSIETWRDPVEFRELISNDKKIASPLARNDNNLNYKWEIHLMVENPEDVAEAWLKVICSPSTSSGTKREGRLAVHLETLRNSALVMDLCQKYDAELMMAINPETIVENLIPYFHNIKNFLVLAVPPGRSGQKITGFTTPYKGVLEKVEFLRERVSDAKIEVDGGINLETARLVKAAGADIVAVASHIFGSHNPEAAYEELKAI